MDRENKRLFEMFAESTGESPCEVESEISRSIEKIKENKEFVIISESFPCLQFSVETI